MFICLIQLFFAFLSEFSGASYFDSYSLVRSHNMHTEQSRAEAHIDSRVSTNQD